MIAEPAARPTHHEPLGWGALACLAGLGYMIVIGGSAVAETDPALRTINVVIAGALLVRYAVRLPRFTDRIDRWVLVAVVAFVAAGVLSSAPRQSLDAVMLAATFAAALFTARDLLSREVIRLTFIRVLMSLSGLLTFIAVARWLPLVLRWWAGTGWTVVPPLSLELSGLPWGHRYDLALLIAMLYPAWWMGRPSRPRRIAAAAMAIPVIFVVAIVGSRTLWLAMALSAAVVLIPSGLPLWKRSSRIRGTILAGAALLLVALVVSGVAREFAQRAFNPTSLGWRTAMWGPLVGVWLAHPIAGYGPGSFPWILQQTAYFNTNTLAPRHPDSALFELIGEGGALGLLAMGTVVAALLRPVLRGRSLAARWALIAFALACLGANPTEFMDLMALAIAWVAFAVPHEEHPQAVFLSRPRFLRVGMAAGAGVLAVAYLATLVAGFSYESFRTALGNGNLQAAHSALNLSVTLDPSMALYWRQRGEVEYILKQPAEAVADLRRATQINPSDDLAWRALGMASEAAGMSTQAGAAYAEAVKVQRSDPINLMLEARWMTEQGRVPEATELLAELVQSWPAIVGAPGWQAILPPSVTTADIVDEAANRWQQGLSTPALPSDQGLWLAVLASRPAMDASAIEAAAISPDLAKAELSLLQCQDATGRLNQAPNAERRDGRYWILRIRNASVDGGTDSSAIAVAGVSLGDPGFLDVATEELNPLDDPPYLADIWGYRRWPVQWPTVGELLPSPDAGAARWLVDPRGAVQASGLASRLPGCS